MNKLKALIEAFIIASENPITAKEIFLYTYKLADSELFYKITGVNKNEITEELITEVLKQIAEKYNNDPSSGFFLRKIANGYIFTTKPELGQLVASMLSIKNSRRLSKSLLETLSIIAYKQPTTKVEIEHIRGVDSSYAIHKLLDMELIKIAGRSDAPGKPLLYKTTSKFLQLIGLNDLTELPKSKEILTEN